MDIRYNINRIHSLLGDKFQDVNICEKTSLKFGKYFEIVVNESKTIKMIIPFKNIDGRSKYSFYYLSNPINEQSELVERISDNESIVSIVEDIFNNNRFSEDYLKS
jgi:benzoyl-CoA reductase/2-hydroxyglutaryl-CoA dehydratase subunit BcrC/BadD/HgdB